MDAVKFLEERNRMCDNYNLCTDGCPLYKICDFSLGYFREMVAAVEKWSKEHPVVTKGMKVLEMIPGNERSTVFKEADSNLKGCGFIISEEYVQMRVRKSWWDAEYKEGEK